jgi:hypothetical protein
MSESLEIQKAKIDSLVAGFTNSGYKSGSRIGQTELVQFLNRRSSTGRFDPIISDKLFQVMNLESTSTLSVEEFINGFLQFEEELRKNAESFSIKLAKEEEIFAQIDDEFRRYREEHLNEEGLSDTAKISGEITEIDIKRKLEGIKEIIIKVVFNEKSEELHFKIGDINSSEMEHKTFEFKPTSRKDHFEFIMKGINERNQIFDIGSKVFPLTDINSNEQYLVQIVVPEIENEEVIAAFIKAKLNFYWNDVKYYEKQRRKAESKLKKLTIAKNKVIEYLKKLREIYGDLTKKKPDLIVDFNNEKLMQRKGAKLNVNFNNIKEAEAPGGNYVVEFNNQKEVLVKQTTEVKETHVEEKKEEVVEPPAEVEVHEKEEITTPPEDLNNLLANAQTTEPVNIESTGNEFNYDEYQTNGYEQIDQNYTGLQSTEVVNETEIRNSIQEAVIRQSLNKPLYQENTLPVIRQEKVNKVIYETNATYLPVIYGGKKVTYLSENESKNFDFSTLQNATEIQGDEYTNINQEFQTGEVKYNEPIQIEGVNYSEGFQTGGVNYNETYETTGQDYTNFGQNNYTTTETTGDYNNLFGNTETTTTTTTTTQTFMGNTQNVDYGQINPIEQGIGFGEYQKTNYEKF